jgi:long-chain acyl-CoA synthetase
VNALNGNQDLLHMDTTITYEDGREARIRTDIKICDIGH